MYEETEGRRLGTFRIKQRIKNRSIAEKIAEVLNKRPKGILHSSIAERHCTATREYNYGHQMLLLIETARITFLRKM